MPTTLVYNEATGKLCGTATELEACCGDLVSCGPNPDQNFLVPASFQIVLDGITLQSPLINPDPLFAVTSGSQCDNLGGQPCVDLEGTYLLPKEDNAPGGFFGPPDPENWSSACLYRYDLLDFLCDGGGLNAPTRFGSACYWTLELFKHDNHATNSKWWVTVMLFGELASECTELGSFLHDRLLTWEGEIVSAAEENISGPLPLVTVLQNCGNQNWLVACDECAFLNATMDVTAVT